MISGSDGKIPIGISGCLLGEKVRYDGGHKYHATINDTLKSYFELISFCPETGAGLGVPRPPIQLVKKSAKIRAVDVRNPGRDVTEVLKTYSHNQRNKIARLCGFIFKAGSPSCGLEKVKVFNEKDVSDQSGRGIFAQWVISEFPGLPVVEERCLDELKFREVFIQQVLSFYRSQNGKE